MTEREQMVARWLDLTRRILPAMALERRWPIRHDHCFMRVFLDHAAGGPWHRTIRRPAIRFMEDDTLRRAIGAAEHVIEHPDTLRAMNDRSLAGRRS